MKKIIVSFMILAGFLISGCTSSKSEYEVNVEELDPNQVVEFKDSEFERMIRETIDKQEGDVIVSDMEWIYSLNINYNEYKVHNIEGIEYAVNLNDFSYRYGEGLDSLDPISRSKTITYLNVSYSIINGETTEFNTPLLERVSFINTNVSDYDFLQNVTTITTMTATDSEVEKIDFIKNMNNLEAVNFYGNNISDISPLKDKLKLTSVNFQNNQISDISVLETCTSLEDIILSYNHVNNIEYLYDLENLMELRIYEDLDKKIIPRTQIEALQNSGVEVYYHK